MKNSTIPRYLIMLAAFIVVIVSIDAMLGKTAERNFWDYFIQGGAFLFAVLLANTAEKHGWDTWSGLISKFKKDR